MPVAKWVELRLGIALLDGALAAAFVVVVTFSDSDIADLTIASLGVASASLAWRRAHPVASGAAAFVSVGAAWNLSTSSVGSGAAGAWVVGMGGAVLAVSTYSLAAWGPRILRSFGLPVALIAATGAGFLLAGIAWSSVLTVALTVACLAWTAGQWRRSQLQHLTTAMERANRAEREAEQAEQLATARERARIARELHDVIAHSLAVMTAQADGARFVVHTSPDQAETALRVIADTGRAASSDMAGLLGLLSDGSSKPSAAVPVLAPQPRLSDLPRLVNDVRTAGLNVSLAVDGLAVEVSPATQVAAYRVVQEALTNVLKHAPSATRAEVRLTWSDDQLDLLIVDNGAETFAFVPGSSVVSSGRGIAGMRERVASCRGHVETGPRSGGGYWVHATLPLDGRAAP